MSDYQLRWITGQLATGNAPMSYADLDLIKAEGVDAIVNLCGEFCDLHEIEEKSGILTIREPSLESNNVVDLSGYFADYEALIHKIDEDLEAVKSSYSQALSYGAERDDCCYRYMDLDLIEAIYLSYTINRFLGSDFRKRVIHHAVEIGQKTQKMIARLKQKGAGIEASKEALVQAYADERIRCALNSKHRCSLYNYRPISCRLHGVPAGVIDRGLIAPTLRDLSRSVFFSFSGIFLDEEGLSFSLAGTVSGKFVQEYFYYLTNLQK
jgi:hypothetical protein